MHFLQELMHGEGVRGSPILRAVLALAALLLLGLPLHSLLKPAEVATIAAPSVGERQVQSLPLALDFTTPPTAFRLLALGKEVWSGTEPKRHQEETVSIPFPKEGIELQLECKWTGEQTAAARLSLTGPDGLTTSKMAWGEGEISEVLSFP